MTEKPMEQFNLEYPWKKLWKGFNKITLSKNDRKNKGKYFP